MSPQLQNLRKNLLQRKLQVHSDNNFLYIDTRILDNHNDVISLLVEYDEDKEVFIISDEGFIFNEFGLSKENIYYIDNFYKVKFNYNFELEIQTGFTDLIESIKNFILAVSYIVTAANIYSRKCS